jgi:hypothetical protein
VTVNRAPVLTRWATVVAERLEFEAATALTLRKAVAGLNTQAKGRRLGIFKPPKLEGGKPPKKHGPGEDYWVELCGRAVPVKNTTDGVRAVVKHWPIDPQLVETYLGRAFRDLVCSRFDAPSRARVAPDFLGPRVAKRRRARRVGQSGIKPEEPPRLAATARPRSSSACRVAVRTV